MTVLWPGQTVHLMNWRDKLRVPVEHRQQKAIEDWEYERDLERGRER